LWDSKFGDTKSEKLSEYSLRIYPGQVLGLNISKSERENKKLIF
jgi:hypothetical protein